MISKYNVNYFKFDNFGGAGPLCSELEALLRIICEMRKFKPDVFVNPTAGSWPSPFWLLYADSIWRGGRDTGYFGKKGSKRQKWITYRDCSTYHDLLEKSPLYPVSSLMLHGIMTKGSHIKLTLNAADSVDAADFVDEIHSFFGTGTNLQELYITPELMKPQLWDVLAEAANWSRANADTLVDTHWAGGDPGKYQVYGWASWSKRKGVLTLRNPDDKPAMIELDIGKVFELPEGAATRYILKSPWKKDVDKPGFVVTAGKRHVFQLKPFEVTVLDAKPSL